MNKKLYNAWFNMHQRCYDPKVNQYPNYGGRGITVCERWRTYANFKADMEVMVAPGLSLDRLDNNGDYEPSNCMWSSNSKQQLNRRNCRWWYIDGVRYESSTQAASALGVHKATIIRMCNGKGEYAPKPGCYSELKYKQEVVL